LGGRTNQNFEGSAVALPPVSRGYVSGTEPMTATTPQYSCRTFFPRLRGRPYKWCQHNNLLCPCIKNIILGRHQFFLHPSLLKFLSQLLGQSCLFPKILGLNDTEYLGLGEIWLELESELRL